MPATTASSRPRSSASSTAAVRRSAVIVRMDPAIESKVEPKRAELVVGVDVGGDVEVPLLDGGGGRR